MSQSKQLNKEHAEKLIEGFFNTVEQSSYMSETDYEYQTFLAALRHFKEFIFNKYKWSAFCPHTKAAIVAGTFKGDRLEYIRDIHNQIEKLQTSIGTKRGEWQQERAAEAMELFSIYKAGMTECFQEKIEES